MTQKSKTIIQLIISGLLLPISLFALTYILLNFIVSSWITEFKVTNQTTKKIEITPIGKWHGNGRLGSLPQYYRKIIVWPAFVQTNLALKPMETKTVFYDWDDINMTGFVIKYQNNYKFFEALPGFKNDHFKIYGFDDMIPATTEMINATKNDRNWFMNLFLFCGLLNIPMFLLLIQKLIKIKKTT